MVLILSSIYDSSTTSVVYWLLRDGEKVSRLNSEDTDSVVTKFDFNSEKFEFLFGNGAKINSEDIKSVWFRRRGLTSKNITNLSIKLANPIIPENSRYIENKLKNELEILLEYFFYNLSTEIPKKIGNPKMSSLNKLVTLSLAKKYGLITPETFVINSLSQFRGILEIDGGRYINKAMAEGIYLFTREKAYYTYTELISSDEIPEKFFPSLVQKCIEKAFEIRSFYLDGDFYSMAIFSQNNDETAIDFRKSNRFKNRTVPYKLPLDVEDKLKRLFDELGLNTGSIDLIKDKVGNFIFLEINPVGQYAMTSQPCNYHLDRLIAKKLKNKEDVKSREI